MLKERKDRLRAILLQLQDLHSQARDIYAEIPAEGQTEEEAEIMKIGAENHHQDSYNAFAEAESLIK